MTERDAKPTKCVLLTGGRAPAALELARLFHAAGHRVLMAESVQHPLSRTSNAIERHFLVPPPRQKPQEYIKALKAIIQSHNVALLVPTCEEIFHVSRGRAQLSVGCEIFVEELEVMRALHDKWTFYKKAKGHGLDVPETRRATTHQVIQDAFSQWTEIVVKPIYSRFAVETLILPSNAGCLKRLEVSEAHPWVVQRFVRGRQLCTYTIVHQGKISAHSTYATEFTAGQGATIAFEQLEHPASRQWVERFVEAESFTGQIAFDFIEDPDGKVFALECNPRATSGAHLFVPQDNLPAAFFGPQEPPASPSNTSPTMIALAMLVYGLPALRSWRQLKRWCSVFWRGKDVIYKRKDPWPGLFQFVGMFGFVWLGIKKRINALKASTDDIEWNGEP